MLKDRGLKLVVREQHASRLGSISPSFYEQLLSVKILAKSAKQDSQVKQLFALSGPAHVKAANKQVDEIDPWCVLYHFKKIET